ncbi:hypothetical protein [Floridanema evergladense]|uniref:Cell division protein FtsL n=1 Tax=Floridaenema evergladense BLCC-F167 TaxID=3153639 RepID=A0ABV4WRX6_9CYAN
MSFAPKSKIVSQSKISSQRLAKSKLSTLSPAVPIWLRWLITSQRYTSAIAFILISATLSSYAAIVYSQQQWNREYQKLQSLQRKERELTTDEEQRKNQLAEIAETKTQGLIPPKPENNLFLEAAPQRPATKNPNTSINSASNSRSNPAPLGY